MTPPSAKIDLRPFCLDIVKNRVVFFWNFSNRFAENFQKNLHSKPRKGAFLDNIHFWCIPSVPTEITNKLAISIDSASIHQKPLHSCIIKSKDYVLRGRRPREIAFWGRPFGLGRLYKWGCKYLYILTIGKFRKTY